MLYSDREEISAVVGHRIAPTGIIFLPRACVETHTCPASYVDARMETLHIYTDVSLAKNYEEWVAIQLFKFMEVLPSVENGMK